MITAEAVSAVVLSTARWLAGNDMIVFFCEEGTARKAVHPKDVGLRTGKYIQVSTISYIQYEVQVLKQATCTCNRHARSYCCQSHALGRRSKLCANMPCACSYLRRGSAIGVVECTDVAKAGRATRRKRTLLTNRRVTSLHIP